MIFTLHGLEFQTPFNKKNIVYVDGEVLQPLEPKRIDSFTWGYAGGGPSAFAEALLVKVKLDEEYLPILREWIQKLPLTKSFSRVLNIETLLKKKYGALFSKELERLQS